MTNNRLWRAVGTGLLGANAALLVGALLAGNVWSAVFAVAGALGAILVLKVTPK